MSHPTPTNFACRKITLRESRRLHPCCTASPFCCVLLGLTFLNSDRLHADPGSLSVATFQVDATPPLGSPLCDGAVKPAKEIGDPLSARGIIILGNGRPIVLCAVDWVGIANGGYDRWRSALAEAALTTADRVEVHTLHQHDTPGCDFDAEQILAEHGLSGAMFPVAFVSDTIDRAALACKEAMLHSSPVTHIGLGRAKVDKVAASRRPLGPDGKVKFVRWSSGNTSQVRAEPEGVYDPYVALVSFWNNDRPLAVLTYYAIHPMTFYGRGVVSSDLVGLARSIREAALGGVPHIHFDGAGGDVTAGKYNNTTPADRGILAERLAAGMKKAWDTSPKAPHHRRRPDLANSPSGVAAQSQVARRSGPAAGDRQQESGDTVSRPRGGRPSVGPLRGGSSQDPNELPQARTGVHPAHAGRT